jgi:hypothetical protein
MALNASHPDGAVQLVVPPGPPALAVLPVEEALVDRGAPQRRDEPDL